MKATGILVVATVVLAAGCGADPTRTAAPAGSAATAPGGPGASVSSTDGSVADAQDTRVRIVQVEGAPPFYVEVGTVEPVGGEGVWGQHDLHVISEWRTAITVAGDDVVVDLTGTVAAEGKLAPEKTVTLQPQERTTVTVTLSAEGHPDLSGLHRVQIQLPFWREVSGDQASSGAPDDVATVTLEYEIPTVTQLAAIEPFCAQAVPAVQAINEVWQEPGVEPIRATEASLEPIATAARNLDDPRASRLLEAIEALRDALDSWQDDDGPHGSGFSTAPIVGPINELCDTDIHSFSVTG